MSSNDETWVFTPPAAAGGVGDYKPRIGDIIYSTHTAYHMTWGDAINQDIPLRFVQVKETYGSLVKFSVYEGAKGLLAEVGLHTLSEPVFLSFLRTGKLTVDG